MALNDQGLGSFDELLPASESIMFKEPEPPPPLPSQDAFSTFELPEFSHFPIDDYHLGDLEFLDLASDRLLEKSNKNKNQFPDIYFNSIATPSGYCSANFLTEEANRLTLLLEETAAINSGDRSADKAGDIGFDNKTLIENLEELFGVGTSSHQHVPPPADVAVGVSGADERGYGVDGRAGPSAVAPGRSQESGENVADLASNSAGVACFDDASFGELLEPPAGSSTGGAMSNYGPAYSSKVAEASSGVASVLGTETGSSMNKVNDRLSAARHAGIEAIHDQRHDVNLSSKQMLTQQTEIPSGAKSSVSGGSLPAETPPPGAVAKIMVTCSKRLEQTRIVFSSIDEKEQYTFLLNTTNMRKATQALKPYNLDSMESIRRLFGLPPIAGKTSKKRDFENSLATTKLENSYAKVARLDTKGKIFMMRPDTTINNRPQEMAQMKSVLSEEAANSTTHNFDRFVSDEIQSPVTQPTPVVVGGAAVSSAKLPRTVSGGKISQAAIIVNETSAGDGILSLPEKVSSHHVTTSQSAKAVGPIPISIVGENNAVADLNGSGDAGGDDGSVVVEAGIISSESVEEEVSNAATPSKTHLEKALAEIGINVEVKKIRLDTGQQYWCCPVPNCHKAFIKGYELKVHVMKHYDKKMFKCDHPGCSWSFVTSHKLKRHKATHAKMKEFECSYPDCGKFFSTNYNLGIHLRGHLRANSFQCAYCTQAFQTDRSLRDHIVRLHSDVAEAEFPCVVEGCGRKFFAQNPLKSHLRWHVTRAQQPAASSNKNLSEQVKTSLKSPPQVNRLKCDYPGCTWEFKTAFKLSRHKKTHNKELHAIHKCPECDKRFVRYEPLRKHLATHQAAPRWRCPHQGCEEILHGYRYLAAHLRKAHQYPISLKDKDPIHAKCPYQDCQQSIARKEFKSHLEKCHVLVDSPNQSTAPQIQDPAQLDFVALLSSVGQDMFLPDELACPEYIVSSAELQDRLPEDASAPVRPIMPTSSVAVNSLPLGGVLPAHVNNSPCQKTTVTCNSHAASAVRGSGQPVHEEPVQTIDGSQSTVINQYLLGHHTTQGVMRPSVMLANSSNVGLSAMSTARLSVSVADPADSSTPTTIDLKDLK